MSYYKENHIHIEPDISLEFQELPDMTGKKVFVAGGTRGMGLEVAKLCRGLGAEVTVSGRHEADLDFPYIRADLTKEEQIAEAYKSVGKVDFVFNNVGMYEKADILDTTPERWREVIDYNLNSMFYLTQHGLRNLNPDGVIVNMSTRPTLEHYKGWSAYTISKVGIITLIQAAAEEHPEFKSYAVCPSRVDTSYRDALYPDEDKTTRLSPQEVAKTVGFLFNGKLPTGSFYWIKKV